MFLKIEGKLMRGFVEILADECLRHLDAGYELEIDLSGLHFADTEGIDLLRATEGQGARLVGESDLIRKLIRDDC